MMLLWIQSIDAQTILLQEIHKWMLIIVRSVSTGCNQTFVFDKDDI